MKQCICSTESGALKTVFVAAWYLSVVVSRIQAAPITVFSAQPDLLHTHTHTHTHTHIYIYIEGD